MANWVVPTSLDADNPASSSTLAACTDWRRAVRIFHVGTGQYQPTSDAGYTTAGSPFLPQLPINLFLCGGSPYRPWLGCSLAHMLPLGNRTRYDTKK